MANELLSEKDDLTKRLKAHVEGATAIRIASAWLTPSDALDALVNAECDDVKVLVGIHGNATDPEAVRSVFERFGADSVRIIEDAPLFHPKLFHFTLPKGRRVVWIGSANFTGGGFSGNRELLLETRDKEIAERARAWFATSWKDLRKQDVKCVLKRYTKRRKKRGIAAGLRDVVQPPVRTRPRQASTAGKRGEVDSIKLVPAPRDYEGRVIFVNGQVETRVEYTSVHDALCKILACLGKDDFLERCSAHRVFRVRHRDKRQGESRYLSNQKEKIKEIRAANGELTPRLLERQKKTRMSPTKLSSGWWVSEDMGPREGWNMVQAASKIAGVKLTPDQDHFPFSGDFAR